MAQKETRKIMLSMSLKISLISAVRVKIKEMKPSQTGIKEKALATVELVVIRVI